MEHHYHDASPEPIAQATLSFLFNLVATVVLVVVVWCTAIGTSANLEETKANACSTFAAAGYECIGYEGYQWGTWVGGSYGGARVWYTLRVKDVPHTVFSGYVKRWGDEYHIYAVTPVNKNAVITQ